MDARTHAARQADTTWFLSHPRRMLETRAARVAYRRIGQGPPLLLVHGWPFSSLTYRRLARPLSEHFTCYLPDTPGLGETETSSRTGFEFSAQAETFREILDGLGLQSCAVLAHDTGATISRRLALIAPERVSRLVLLNTEIPGHRPPWIETFQHLTRLPASDLAFSLLLRSARFRSSAMGYGGCFSDAALLDADFVECFVTPLLRSSARMRGVVDYLRGIDWAMVDGFARDHARIEAPVLFVWGADDRTFPVRRAREMVTQLPHCAGIREIARACLLAHEERPAEVAAVALPFLLGAATARVH